MRVQVQIPGTVESYCVDERGNKLEATEEHWLETYLCSVLRAYSYADNGSGDVIKRIVGVRRFNPVQNVEQEQRFLDAAEKLFFSGSYSAYLIRSSRADSFQAGNWALTQKFKCPTWSQTTSHLVCYTTSGRQGGSLPA